MVDGKLISLFRGLGGVFCCLFSYSKEQCNTLNNVKAGFPFDRSLEQTNNNHINSCFQNLSKCAVNFQL